MDFSAEEGPFFVAFDANPFFLTSQLLEIPCTIDYVGWLGSAAARVRTGWRHRPVVDGSRAVGVFAKTRRRQQDHADARGNYVRGDARSGLAACSLAAVARSRMSFHSPSVEPGHTPYVRSRGRSPCRFFGDIERFCEFFMHRLEGRRDEPADVPHQDVSTMAESDS